MIKYVLCGGAAHIPDKRNDLFFKEVLKDTPNKVKILLVLFSKKGEKIRINSKEDILQFERVNNGKEFRFKIAHKDDFLKQISWADVIYIHGGSPEIQIPVFRSFTKEKLQNIFDNKIVAGDSAGIYFIAEYVFSVIKKKMFKGLGLLPIKLICHYSKGDETNLKNIHNKLKEVLLKEYEYKVIYSPDMPLEVS